MLQHTSDVSTISKRSLGRDMGVFRDLEVWPKFYLRIYGIVCNILLYCTAIYR